MRRVYDGNILVDWNIPPDAAVYPPDETARRKWGWRQDDQGRWYRVWPLGSGWKTHRARPLLAATNFAPASDNALIR